MANALIDNSEQFKLVKYIKEIVSRPDCNHIMIATGYWDLPGTALVYNELKDFFARGGKLDLLIGQEPQLQYYQATREVQKFPDFYIQRYTLSELYITMENLRELNLPIDERLKQEAAKLEEDLICTEILPTFTEKIEPALAQVQREFVLVVDYVPGEPLKVSLFRKRNLFDALEDVVEIKADLKEFHC